MGQIIHRLPSIDERIKCIDYLKLQISDTDHAFFVFCQSFGTEQEREYASKTFGIKIQTTQKPK